MSLIDPLNRNMDAYDTYNVVIEKEVTQLITVVKRMMAQGWQLQGGAFQTHDGYFGQALCRTPIIKE